MKSHESNGTLPPITELKRRISAMEQSIATRFWNDDPVANLVARRARSIDSFLNEIWNQVFDTDTHSALLAVGGYGRDELHPRSDIDLLILVRDERDKTENLEAFIRLLWDLNLDIGHSVRTIRECRKEAKNDVTVYTAISERRLITGSARLSHDLERALNRDSIWPIRAFFTAKETEQEQRHEEYSDVEHGLEPNIKTSPGGLRDIQTISWITNRYCGSSNLNELSKLGLLTESEQRTLVEGREFLWRVRFALHLVSKRKQDQILFDHQREVATAFGYEDTDGMLAVEMFMRDYYQRVLALREVNDILLQHFDEAILQKGKRLKIQPINERFQKCNNYIEVTHRNVFRDCAPALLMEIFVVMANRPDIVGVRANTIRLIKEHLYLVDENFRKDSTVSELFLSLLKSPHNVVSQLTRMRRYGLLGEYIPEFGRVIGQMQHDLFHIYTVDAHTMTLIRNVRRMFMPQYADAFGAAGEIAQDIPKIELLYIAGLFHDIGKGRTGNHSSLGAMDVEVFCEKFKLPLADCELVVWLVQEHLTMSMTAQREDPGDPDVVEKFAANVETPNRLRYLLLLTVADIQATNPNLWNAWRATLLMQLFFATMQHLKLGENDVIDSRLQIAQRKRETAALLDSTDIKGIHLDLLWEDTDDDFVLHHSTENLVRIAVELQRKEDSNNVVTLVLNGFAHGLNQSVVEIFISTQNRTSFFADCVNTLDQLNLQIVSANICTGRSERVYDSFIVISNTDSLQSNEIREHIRQTFTQALTNHSEPTRPRRQRLSRQHMQFKRRTKITVSGSDRGEHSTLTLEASDRPGLPARVSSLFVEFNIELHQARIATLGERVEDTFNVTFRNMAGQFDHAAAAKIIAEMVYASD